MNEDAIILTETEYPKRFTNYVSKEYGLLFYNENNRESYDSNHVILYADKLTDLGSILDEIRDFYLGKGLTPRIYHPFANGFLEQNRNCFLTHGYTIEVYDNCQYMILTAPNKICLTKKLTVKQLKKWDDRIATQIFLPDRTEYGIEVIKDYLKCENYKLFVGYLNDVAVTTASLFYSEYGCVRLDDVETSITYRNNGYSRELISTLIEYHKKNGNAIFYLWAENPTAQKIYKEAGFTLLEKQYETWSAVYLDK